MRGHGGGEEVVEGLSQPEPQSESPERESPDPKAASPRRAESTACGLDHLRRRWPKMAQRLEGASPLPGGAVQPGRGGEPTLLLRGEDGLEVLLHSRYDPRAEARQQVAAAGIDPGDTVILLGIGLGYALEEILAAKQPGLIIAVERDPAVLAAALDRGALAGFLGRADADLLVGGEPEEIFGVLERNLSRVFSGPVRVLVHPAAARIHSKYYEGLNQGLREFTRHGTVLMRSALYLSRISLQNRLENLHAYAASPGLKPLWGRFRSYPAVVVSAGPSLDRNVDRLRSVRGRAVVIAVSTALKIVLSRGIRPDFAVVIDYHSISARYFEGVDPALAPPLVCDLKASPASLAVYSGPKLFGSDPLVDLLLDRASGDKGVLAAGSTVAHTAFDVARRLGCDPIIFVGQDLSYPAGRLHAAGSAITAQQLPETNRFYSLEMKEWEYYLAHRRQLSKVPAALGGEVWTCDVFLSYLREFEKMFRESPQKIVDATEGGALKAGTEVSTLDEAIERHCASPIPPELFSCAVGPEEARAAEARRERSREALGRRLEEAEDLLGSYRTAIRLLEEIVEVNRRGLAADGAAARVIALKEEFRKHEFYYWLLNEVAQADLFIRQKKDRALDVGDLRGVERQKAQAERDLEYVRGLRGALEFLIERMRGAERALAPSRAKSLPTP